MEATTKADRDRNGKVRLEEIGNRKGGEKSVGRRDMIENNFVGYSRSFRRLVVHDGDREKPTSSYQYRTQTGIKTTERNRQNWQKENR